MNGQVHVGKENKQVKQHYYATSSILMRVYNMTIPAKHCLVTIFNTNSYHTLVVCYRAHYSISYLARGVQTVTSWDSEVTKC